MEEHIEETETPQTDSTNSMDYTQWQYAGDDIYVPSKAVEASLPSQWYEIVYNADTASFCFYMLSEYYAELAKFETEDILPVIDDISDFFKYRNIYHSAGLTHRKSMLLYGERGCNIERIIQTAGRRHSEADGVTVFIRSGEGFADKLAMAEALSIIEPDRDILFVFDNCEWIFTSEEYIAALRKFMKEYETQEHIFLLFTTHDMLLYKASLQAPSVHFDSVCRIGFPDEQFRKEYIWYKMQTCDVSKSEMDGIVKNTNGFSIGDIQQYIAQYLIKKEEDKHNDNASGTETIYNRRFWKNIIGFGRGK